MIIPIELRFKADKDSKSAFRTDKTIKSHDVNSVEFHISIDGLELTDNHTAKILSIFHSSKSQANVDCEIVEGKIIYKPDTNLISRHEHVTNYVYVYKGNQSLDVREFIYIVDLSKIDETSLEVKEVYDQSYADLLADFEQALNDYKDNLPQADSVRADIDEVLNQFSEDGQAKLSLVDEAEESRVQAEGQRESSESSRVSAETTRVLAEGERENAEAQRKIDHANKSAELAGKADKVVLKNLASTPMEVPYVEDFEGETSDVWYASIKARYIRYNSGRTRLTLRDYGNSNNATVVNLTSQVSENFESYSVQADGKINGTRLIISSDLSPDLEVDIKNLIVLNLTETFGTGNEPTKEEMDELIKVTGYIDGEYALNNKEVLIWTLALIRRNKNAIVALGGA